MTEKSVLGADLRRKLLLIAFHFPPLQGSSGIQRSLAFAKYLPEFGWQAAVSTVKPFAYEQVNLANEKLIPASVPVIRSAAFDTRRHFSIAGRYPDFLAIPDRWQSWIPTGIMSGLRYIRQHRPSAIMSTFPIASAHIIARTLHRRTGLPWIADLRDPMVFESYPSPGPVREAFIRIEKTIFAEASRIVVTTPGAARMYRERYQDRGAEKVLVIENGVDHEVFDKLGPVSNIGENRGGKLRFVHSGIVYPGQRDPASFLDAIAQLKASRSIRSQTLEVVFRASGHDEYLSGLIAKYDLHDIVSLAPPIPYVEALSEMRSSDVLLILQASNCNDQIPAKVYECLYSGTPVLGLTDPAGDTAQVLRNYGVDSIAPLDDSRAIVSVLRNLIPAVREGTTHQASSDHLASLSRRQRTRELAETLNSVSQ